MVGDNTSLTSWDNTTGNSVFPAYTILAMNILENVKKLAMAMMENVTECPVTQF